MSYFAKVIQANDIVVHPNADKLNILRYGNEQFVISKDIEIGQIVVLFPTDGQLSHEFCKFNNLYRDTSKNRDKSKAGFFEDGRRVRSQPFRGVKSYGFVATLEMFDFVGNFSLSAGDEFDTLNKTPICNKYYTKKTLEAMKKVQGKKVKDIEYTMKEHIDTEKWQYTKPQSLEERTLVVVTEKIHGTSARTSLTKVVHRNQNIFQKILSNVFRKFIGKEYSQYEYVSGTRRTVINNRLDVTIEGQTDYYRWEWHNKIAPQLHVGETVYYEIVGWDSTGGTIMEKQNLSTIKKDNIIKNTWRNPMIYSYGLPEGQNDVYVYRVTLTSNDGTVSELSWYEVQKRCRELGLKTVPLQSIYMTMDIADLEESVSVAMVDGSSWLDNRHLMEGIVIRTENSSGIKWYKSKNFAFGLLEGYLKQDENYVDTEEVN
ncbi:MAG: RNA ligase family protein [Microgenomates group bacterium]